VAHSVLTKVERRRPRRRRRAPFALLLVAVLAGARFAGGLAAQDVGAHLGLLAALALVMACLATRAFRTYQRSL
jgi:hypothetical protein